MGKLLVAAAAALTLPRGCSSLQGHTSPALSIDSGVVGEADKHIKAWFDVVEAEMDMQPNRSEYTRAPTCADPSIAYINVVIHVTGNTWKVHCGSLDAKAGSRGPPLKELLDVVVKDLPADIDVHLPFGLHDGVQNMRNDNQQIPVLGTVYHPLYSSATVPFAMGCERAISRIGYINTPVVGWDNHVREWFTCNSTAPTVKRAVFRGKGQERGLKFGTCTNACSLEDNGRMYVHNLGKKRPDLFDTWVSNADQITGHKNRHSLKDETFLALTDQLCEYQAILNVGSNSDWAERLRGSFYGNAVVMFPENAPHEFFNSFMEPYRSHWPIKPDLSDTVEQASRVMSLTNLTEQLQAQKQFAATYLTEHFMYLYDRLTIMEYDRRVKEAKKGAADKNADTEAAAEAARSALGLHACRKLEIRKCPSKQSKKFNQSAAVGDVVIRGH